MKDITQSEMIDFIKAKISGPTVGYLLSHGLLNFTAEIDIKTGEVNSDVQIAKYRDLKFIIKYNKYINLQGSIHKYWASGINYNDFNIYDITRALNELSTVFKIDLAKSTLHNVEYGVNIKLNVSPQVLIKSLLNYKRDLFQPMYGEARRTGRQCVKQQYIIKAYNKGWQCKLPDQLFRFEIKVIKMKYLERYNIRSLNDLTSPEKLNLLANDLSDTFNEILIHDPKIDIEKCKATERNLLREGRYAEYWQNLRKENRKKHDYYRSQFRSLTEKYGQNYQKKVADLINNKAHELLKMETESLANLTKDINLNNLFIDEKSLAKLTKPQTSSIVENNHSSGMVNRQVKSINNNARKCEGCGSEFRGRKSTARYCSEECRIKSKNRRRDIRLPLKRFAESRMGMGILFDTHNLIELSDEQREIMRRYSIVIE